jgi:hypothetical protein
MTSNCGGNDGNDDGARTTTAATSFTARNKAKRTLIVSCVVCFVLIVHQFSRILSTSDTNDFFLDNNMTPVMKGIKIKTTTTTTNKTVPPFRQADRVYHHNINKNHNTFQPIDRINGVGRHYVKSPFFQVGYKPAGGLLPVENGDYLSSERMWKYVDNTTCVTTGDDDDDDDGDETNDKDNNNTFLSNISSWQHRAPYAIILGAMKVSIFEMSLLPFDTNKNKTKHSFFFDNDEKVADCSD